MQSLEDRFPPRSEWQRWFVWLCTGDMPTKPQRSSFDKVHPKSVQPLGPTFGRLSGGMANFAEAISSAFVHKQR